MGTAIGIDLGSRATKIVKLENSRLVFRSVFQTSHNPLSEIKETLQQISGDVIVATGYGRNLLKEHVAAQVITEIKACARGAYFFNDRCKTVIDIGGQDSKVIKVQSNGSFSDFEMNDRCAAGTGKFLEVMAHTLNFPLDEFGAAALKADSSVKINSICTVFAESEVVALITSGEQRNRIALGLHESIIDRITSMILRLIPEEEIMFVGGVAKNPCMYQLLQQRLSKKLYIPEDPQIVVAVGAALHGLD